MPGNPEKFSEISPQEKGFDPIDGRAFIKKHYDAIMSSDPQKEDGADFASGVVVRIIAADRQEISRQKLLESMRQEYKDSQASEDEIKEDLDRQNVAIDNLIKNYVLVEEDGVLKLAVAR